MIPADARIAKQLWRTLAALLLAVACNGHDARLARLREASRVPRRET